MCKNRTIFGGEDKKKDKLVQREEEKIWGMFFHRQESLTEKKNGNSKKILVQFR